MSNICKDCNGQGKWAGLNLYHQCKTCGGTGSVKANAKKTIIAVFQRKDLRTYYLINPSNYVINNDGTGEFELTAPSLFNEVLNKMHEADSIITIQGELCGHIQIYKLSTNNKRFFFNAPTPAVWSKICNECQSLYIPQHS